MPTKQEKAAKKQLADRNSNLILAVFVLALCYMLVIAVINRLYSSITLALPTRDVLWFVGAAAALAGALLTALGVRQVKTAGQGHYLFNLLNIGAASLFLGIIVLFAAWLFIDGITILYGLVPVFGVLTLVLIIYPRELFFASLPLGGGIVALLVLPLTGHFSPSAIGITAVSLFGIAAYAALAAFVRKNGGEITFGSRKTEIMPQKALYRWIFLTCLLTAVMIVLGFVLGAAAARYALMSLVACFIILAVHYTAKK